MILSARASSGTILIYYPLNFTLGGIRDSHEFNETCLGTELGKHALTYLDERLMKILVDFENKYPTKVEKPPAKNDNAKEV